MCCREPLEFQLLSLELLLEVVMNSEMSFAKSSVNWGFKTCFLFDKSTCKQVTVLACHLEFSLTKLKGQSAIYWLPNVGLRHRKSQLSSVIDQNASIPFLFLVYVLVYVLVMQINC